MVSSVEGHHAQILKGVLDMCVLASIADTPDYGYALVQKLNEQGLAVANEGSVYLVLKRLKAHGRVDDELVASDSGPARKVYHATPAGRDVLDEWMADWASVRDGVDAVLAGRAPRESAILEEGTNT